MSRATERSGSRRAWLPIGRPIATAIGPTSSPWGWTWVDDEPWGFAPFHYGRWAYAENRWCWVPGPVAVRPVYAPALVAFVGGVSISIGGGPGVGWFPLAPGEVYMPYYRGSRGYVERVNVTNTVVNVTRVTNVYNVYNSNERNVTKITYVNQRVNNGVTLVSRDTFVNARPVQRNLGRFDARQMADARVERGHPGTTGQGQRVGLGCSRTVQAAASDCEPPGGCDPKAGAAPAAFRTRAGGVNVRTEQPNARPQPLTPQGNERPVARPQQPVSPVEAERASPSQRASS